VRTTTARRIASAFFLWILLLTPALLRAEEPSEKVILGRILEKAEANDKLLDKYGSSEEAKERELDADGKVKDEETKTYRTIWIERKPYQQLVLVDGSPLNSKQRSEEEKRRAKFVEAIHKNKPSEDEIRLSSEDLFAKYDFTMLPPDELGRYVFAFAPKKNVKLHERNRAEKVVNHLAGKFWADENFNFVRAEAALQEKVTFGLGLLASLNRLELLFTQQAYDGVFLPVDFRLKVEARLLLFKTVRQEVISHSFDYFKAP
jgi:hypothetical protein